MTNLPQKKTELKEKRSNGKVSFAVFVLLIAVFTSTGISYVYATDALTDTIIQELTAEEIAAQEKEKAAAIAAAKAEAEAQAIRDAIAQKNADLAEIQNQIDTYQKWLNSAQDESKTLQGTIKTLDVERQRMLANINKTQNRLDSTKLNVQQLGIVITETERKIQDSLSAVAEVLRTTDQADSRSLVETVLSQNKLSEILDERVQLTQLQDKISEHLGELRQDKEALITQKTQLETDSKKLVVYKTTLVDQKSILDNSKREKNNILLATKNRESDYQKILRENLAKKEEFERELDAYQNKLTRQLSAKEIPTETHSLLWPLDDVVVTQEFGITKDSVRLYASGTHNGIDLRANRGTPVKTPAIGVVIGTGDTDISCPKASYGKWVLIKHNNGLTTLMSHFDLIKVTTGQELSAGDLVGYSGTTGYATGPHLHISVFASGGVIVGKLASKSCSGRTFTIPLLTAKNAYLDPELYFPTL